MLPLVLRTLRIAKNINTKEAAEQLKCNSSYISLLESGTRSPSMEVLDKYSKVYGIPLSKILEFNEEDERRGIEDYTRRFQILLLTILKYYLEEKPRQLEEAKSK